MVAQTFFADLSEVDNAMFTSIELIWIAIPSLSVTKK